MTSARHSYELKIFEQDKANRDERGNPRLVRMPGPDTRAEGVHLDAARKHARELAILATGRVVRSLNVAEQRQARPGGPKTGTIVVVVHGKDRTVSDRTMVASRLSRGIPREIAKK